MEVMGEQQPLHKNSPKAGPKAGPKSPLVTQSVHSYLVVAL
jgi:hypothetical protein